MGPGKPKPRTARRLHRLVTVVHCGCESCQWLIGGTSCKYIDERAERWRELRGGIRWPQRQGLGPATNANELSRHVCFEILQRVRRKQCARYSVPFAYGLLSIVYRCPFFTAPRRRSLRVGRAAQLPPPPVRGSAEKRMVSKSLPQPLLLKSVLVSRPPPPTTKKSKIGTATVPGRARRALLHGCQPFKLLRHAKYSVQIKTF